MTEEETKWLFKTLRQVKFFSSFSLGDLEFAIKRFQKYSYPKGKVIIKENRPGQAFFVIYRGKVAVTQKKSLFKRKLLKELSSGDFFGEISLISNEPTMATVKVVEPSEIFVLLKNEFQQILQQNPELAKEIRFIAEKRQFESEI